MTTRVLIVDDHPMVTDGIEAILETYDDINVVGTLNNGQEAVDQIDTLAPDVVLLDLNMPGLSGLAATEMILEKRSPTALSHGAKGYILKDVPTDEIHEAIQTVVRGQEYLCGGAKGSLSPKSKSNKEVASDLNISVRTVETHRQNIKRKLGISSIAGLTRYALEHGVLQGTGI